MSMGTPTGYQPAQKSRNGMAIAALVCGIVGVFLLEVILGPLAIIFGAIGLRRANAGGPNRGMAAAGLALGILDVVLFVALIAISSTHGGLGSV
jgi:hypothetical protein